MKINPFTSVDLEALRLQVSQEKSDYGPEDYRTSQAADRLRQLGQLRAWYELQEVMTDQDPISDSWESMDPMELLIALEEHGTQDVGRCT